MKPFRPGLVLCSLVVGCSGGGGTSLTPGQPSTLATAGPGAPSATKRGAAAFAILIPKATAASEKRVARLARARSSVRRPQYVSAGTQSLVVVLTAVNSIAVTSPVNYAVNIGGAGCTSSNGGTTCTLVVPASAGTDSFTIRTYDAPQSTANPVTLAGDILSAQTTNVSVVANTANVVSVPVVLDALVASMNVSAGAGYGWLGSQTVPISIQLRDAAGDLIVGPGAFLDGNGNPITVSLADSDATVTSLPTTSFTATTLANASLTYTGAGLPAGATLTASAPGIVSATATFAPRLKSGTLVVGTNHGAELWDSTVSPPTHVTTLGNSTQVVSALALGANGTLYLNINGTGTADTIVQYAPGATSPTSSPLVPGQSSYSLAVATSGRIYAARYGAYAPVYFDPGSASPVTTASTYQYGFGLAVDPASQRLVATDQYKLKAYTSDLTMTPTLLPNITAPFQPTIVTFRSDGTLFIINSSTGNTYSMASPLGVPGTLTQVTTGGNGLYGLAFNAAGDMFISFYTAIYKVPAGSALPATPSLYLTTVSSGLRQLVIAP